MNDSELVRRSLFADIHQERRITTFYKAEKSRVSRIMDYMLKTIH
jgi:hypothetical protein